METEVLENEPEAARLRKEYLDEKGLEIIRRIEEADRDNIGEEARKILYDEATQLYYDISEVKDRIFMIEKKLAEKKENAEVVPERKAREEKVNDRKQDDDDDGDDYYNHLLDSDNDNDNDFDNDTDNDNDNEVAPETSSLHGRVREVHDHKHVYQDDDGNQAENEEQVNTTTIESATTIGIDNKTSEFTSTATSSSSSSSSASPSTSVPMSISPTISPQPSAFSLSSSSPTLLVSTSSLASSETNSLAISSATESANNSTRVTPSSVFLQSKYCPTRKTAKRKADQIEKDVVKYLALNGRNKKIKISIDPAENISEEEMKQQEIIFQNTIRNRLHEALPRNWQVQFTKNNIPYFFNTFTGKSQFPPPEINQAETESSSSSSSSSTTITESTSNL